jgi:hypothetical protein
MDGVGAQLQRIISVYGVAKLAKSYYLHSGLVDIDPQAFSVKTIGERQTEIDQWNQLFTPDLVAFSELSSDKIISAQRISLFKLRAIRLLTRFSRRRVVYKMGNPRLISDKFPECLLDAPEMLNSNVLKMTSSKSQSEFTIVIHIRQGVLVLSQFKHRLLPLSHYEKILRHLVPILESAKVEYKVVIPKENGQDNKIPITDPEVSRSIELDPGNMDLTFIENGYVTLNHEKPNAVLTPLLFQANWLPERTVYSDFLEMMWADLLIISKSSLSFVAGLLNENSIKIYTPFWHTTPPNWINANDLSSSISHSGLKKQILDALKGKSDEHELEGDSN